MNIRNSNLLYSNMLIGGADFLIDFSMSADLSVVTKSPCDGDYDNGL